MLLAQQVLQGRQARQEPLELQALPAPLDQQAFKVSQDQQGRQVRLGLQVSKALPDPLAPQVPQAPQVHRQLLLALLDPQAQQALQAVFTRPQAPHR